MRWISTWLVAALGMIVMPVPAQVRTVDPNQAIDSDLTSAPRGRDRAQDRIPAEAQPPVAASESPVAGGSRRVVQEERAEATTRASETYERDDLMAAGEGVFGKGAEGLAGIIERILKDQGRPNAYIAGREASGAFVVGLRYGSGVMTHKVEGQQPVFWTGPSVGFDVGGDANKVFVLVYNLYDTEDLFHRFPAAEGRLYAIGGFAASYLRRGKVVLIPIRLGVGWRAGVNVGYMNITHKSRWLPF
ncbi:MAG: DUF1134 domain-containing protein [Alphaproteobacteria bacterium]|nr:MAG: DUF1134 domain-containing protein [Alphaproteobacteria bacterium]